MAPRHKIRHDENTRAKIQVARLINRLQCFIFNKDDPQTGHPVKMDSVQLRAIEILLKKAIPDLSSVEANMNMTVSHDDAVKQIEEMLKPQQEPNVVLN